MLAFALLARAAVLPCPSPAATIARVERSVVHCTNHQRGLHGLPPLRRSSVLRRAARYHARNMLRYHFFDHLDVFGQSPLDRVRRFGSVRRFSLVGENIAENYGSGREACREWMASPEHRANILDRRFRIIGTGFARGRHGRTYFVEDFGARRRRR